MYNLADVTAQYVSQISRCYDKEKDILKSEVLQQGSPVSFSIQNET